VEEFAQQLEARASLPPQLQWMSDVTSLSSGLELSDVQPSVSIALGWPDEPCNKSWQGLCPS
jgi:hypothetical protein